MGQHRILLVIAGGIAAYKSLELIRRLRERGDGVRCVVTAAAAELVSPLAVASLSGESVHQELFSLTDEADIGHIRLSREADLVVVAPATADLLAKMAHGLADDLASTVLLATDKPVLVAPAMNPRMWQHAASRRNLACLRGDGIHVIGPAEGDTACGEPGEGRMVEPAAILAAIDDLLAPPAQPLAGLRALVTSGPTHEAIDPVRFIGNRSSGRQGHAVAGALADAGAEVTLVTGPVVLPDPPSVRAVHVESARQMLDAALAAGPVDVAVCAAAVADWRVADPAAHKVKKRPGSGPPDLVLTENPDILRTLSQAGPDRPRLVIGFAAETDDVVAHAEHKLVGKGCDWIVANDVSAERGTFGGDHNTVHLIRRDTAPEAWPELPKAEVAAQLVARIVADLVDGAGPRPAATGRSAARPEPPGDGGAGHGRNGEKTAREHRHVEAFEEAGSGAGGGRRHRLSRRGGAGAEP